MCLKQFENVFETQTKLDSIAQIAPVDSSPIVNSPYPLKSWSPLAYHVFHVSSWIICSHVLDCLGSHTGSYALDLNPQVSDKGSFTEMDYKHAAGCIPTSRWECDFATVTWQVKWVVTGLAPVRPCVVLTSDVVLKPQHALSLGMKS